MSLRGYPRNNDNNRNHVIDERDTMEYRSDESEVEEGRDDQRDDVEDIYAREELSSADPSISSGYSSYISLEHDYYNDEQRDDCSLDPNKHCEQEEEHDQAVTTVTTKSNKKDDVFARYENMVSHQDAEEKATLSHLRPLFDYLVTSFGNNEQQDEEEVKKIDVLSYEEDMMVPALTQSGSSAIGEDEEVDDAKQKKECVMKKSDGSKPYCLSLDAIDKALSYMERVDPSSTLSSSEHSSTSYEHCTWKDMDDVITTDRQLMLLLRTLSSSHPQVRRDTATSQKDDSLSLTSSLSFPEFVHCYRTVIMGMQALAMLPHQKDDDNNEAEDAVTTFLLQKRTKTRDRTLDMVRMFGPSQQQQQPLKTVRIMDHRSGCISDTKQRQETIDKTPQDHMENLSWKDNNNEEDDRNSSNTASIEANNKNKSRRMTIRLLYSFCLMIVGVVLAMNNNTLIDAKVKELFQDSSLSAVLIKSQRLQQVINFNDAAMSSNVHETKVNEKNKRVSVKQASDKGRTIIFIDEADDEEERQRSRPEKGLQDEKNSNTPISAKMAISFFAEKLQSKRRKTDTMSDSTTFSTSELMTKIRKLERTISQKNDELQSTERKLVESRRTVHILTDLANELHMDLDDAKIEIKEASLSTCDERRVAKLSKEVKKVHERLIKCEKKVKKCVDNDRTS